MDLDVRLDGFDEPIGRLVSNQRGAVSFAYDGEYLRRPDALGISLSLPLQEEPFDDYSTRAYFDNLLQERDTARADIIAKYRLANDDIVGILYYLGKDCAGAISVLPQGAPPTKVPGDLAQDYRPYSDVELEAIVLALHRREPLPSELADPSPLAGVQSKIAVAVLPDGRIAEPINGAPTTHILKVPRERSEREAAHEHDAMALSANLGFDTATTELMKIAGVPVLRVERFDRRLEATRVTRLHQEDFCQALGLHARQKYQRPDRGDNGYSAQAIRGILDRTVEPAAERSRFLRVTLFDILIGNVDGHAKNFALFHLAGGRVMTTPRYDVIPTMLDRGTTDEFAYRLGPASSLDELDGAALDTFLADLGFSSAAGRKRILSKALDQVMGSLAAQIDTLGRTNKNFADLLATNIRTLCYNLGRDIPVEARDRDTYVR
ncbi:HipA domain-containing protein [Devosia albogilva]|uniref:HipA domain-containing protein n=1 Tax=Devosia albogilva TaxID=429726 RepID=A0ABW5QMY1_9HYPH